MIELIKCTSGTLVVKLGAEFSGITVRALGERVNRGEGFCLSIESITQMPPAGQKLSPDEQRRIAHALLKWENAPVQFEFYEAL